jgi:hypothetical protein
MDLVILQDAEDDRQDLQEPDKVASKGINKRTNKIQ